MRIAFLEPHLGVAGGIRHVLELGNHLIARGHDVTYLLPSSEPLRCDWMPCRGRIAHIDASFHIPFDALVFNDESQWSLVDSFKRTALTVYYLLGYGALYDKPGSRESYRYPVDLRIANSGWVAECIEQEIGIRPVVVTPGIDLDLFRPVKTPTVYDVLTYGSARASKGTKEVEEACRRLGVRLEKYEGKNLPQSRLAKEYCKARVFAVGSYVEGFGLPGLEALACGVPLATTDNGGCREYAVHEETALVVPPRDAEALAGAIKRLLEDRELAARLRRKGLARVKRFSWPERARQFEELLQAALTARRRLTLAIDRPQEDAKAEIERKQRAAQVAAYTRPIALPGEKPAPPQLTSIITLSWDQPYYTEKLAESLRAHTDTPYELIIVDNGSKDETRQLVKKLADRAILNPENVGFAAGMNQGARAAQGEYLVFLNNDVTVPPGWLSKLVEASQAIEGVGIVAPAVTAGGSFVTVRSEPHEVVREVLPFSLPPAAVCYLVPRAEFEAAGGWCEEYRLGGAEDIDLCFTMWARGRRVLVDERVLIVHHSKGTAAAKLVDWEEIWRQNRELLIDRWSTAEPLIAPPDGELSEAIAELRRTAQGEQLAPLLDRLASLLTERERAWAAERAMMAAGVAQSWREAARQRKMAIGLRKQLKGSLLRKLYRKVVRRR